MLRHIRFVKSKSVHKKENREVNGDKGRTTFITRKTFYTLSGIQTHASLTNLDSELEFTWLSRAMFFAN